MDELNPALLQLLGALLQLLCLIIAGAIWFYWFRDRKRKDSAINAILAKLALEKMDPSERQKLYETTTQKTFKVTPEEAKKIPQMLVNMSERRRLPLLSLTFVIDEHPSPVEGESWRKSFADIDRSDKQVSYAVNYFKEKYGIKVLL